MTHKASIDVTWLEESWQHIAHDHFWCDFSDLIPFLKWDNPTKPN